MKKNQFFASIPKSPTQMGSFSVKKASSRFSRLGFPYFKECTVCVFICTKQSGEYDSAV